MNFAIRVAVVATASIALAGCVPAAPEYVPDAPASSEAPVDAAPLGLTSDHVAAALTTLPAPDPLTWQGGTAKAIAGERDDVDWFHFAEPEQCLVFYAAESLAFTGDSEAEREEVVMTTSLISPHGPGYDDNEWFARVTVRLLDDPTLAEDLLFDPMAAAAPGCSSYFVHYTLGDWRTTDVHSLIFTDNVAIHPSASRAQTGLVDETALEYGNTSWALALVDNALVFVAYYGGEGAPYPDADGATTLMQQVVDALDTERSR